jgi:fimbrial chaperone protein
LTCAACAGVTGPPRALPLAVLSLLTLLALPAGASAQGIMVSPVVVQMPPGAMATALTLANHGGREVSVQVRTFAWMQTKAEGEQLAATDELGASPPFAAIAPGASQVVRLVLHRPPSGREATYRILIDELPAPSEPQRVRIALRFSIPVFAAPDTRASSHVDWRISTGAGQAWLIAINNGTQHQTFRDITLHTADGRALRVEVTSPPHILAGSTRHWRILTQGAPLAPASVMRLTAGVDNGSVDQTVRVDVGP